MVGNPDSLLKPSHINSITGKHSPGLPWRSRVYGSTRDIQDEFELYGFGVGDERTHCPCVESVSHGDYRRMSSFLC